MSDELRCGSFQSCICAQIPQRGRSARSERLYEGYHPPVTVMVPLGRPMKRIGTKLARVFMSVIPIFPDKEPQPIHPALHPLSRPRAPAAEKPGPSIAKALLDKAVMPDLR